MAGLPFEELPAQNDPLEMLGQMTRQQLTDLDQQVTQAEQQATAESSNRIQTLQQEWRIEKQGLEQEWNQLLDMDLDQETLQKHWNRLKLGVATLQQKYALADTRIRGKNRPDLLAIQQAKQSAITKINQQATARQQEIAFWQRAEQEGLDHYICLAGQLRAVGKEVSASQLRPVSPSDQINEIDQQRQQLKGGTLIVGKDENGQPLVSNQISLKEQTQIEARLLTKRNQLIRQMGGQYAGPMQTATRLQRVAAQQGAGTFAQGIAEQKPGKKLLTREAAQRYKKAGLTKEQAMQMAVSEGYEVE